MPLLNHPYAFEPAANPSQEPMVRPPMLAAAGPYLPDKETVHAVNLALHLGVPLLVTGEPGVGKTRLAGSIADRLGWGAPLRYQVKADSEPKQVLYHFDALGRLYDAQRHDARADDPKNYRRFEALGEAISRAIKGIPSVLLIDEIDKAPNDFPNGLLQELEEFRFFIQETGESFALDKEHTQPLVIITSNSERRLPDPFLRRCLVHEIPFPEPGRLAEIVASQLRLDLSDEVLTRALQRFWEMRDPKLSLSKKPSTADLLMWLRALAVSKVTAAELEVAPSELPGLQALLKQRDDLKRLREK